MQHDTSLNLCMYFYRAASNCLQQCSSDRSGEDSLAACGRGESKASLATGRLQDTAGPGRSHGLFHTRPKTKWIRKPRRQTEVVDGVVGSQELVQNKLRNPILTPLRQWLSLQGFLLVNRAQWRSQGWVILSPAWPLPCMSSATTDCDNQIRNLQGVKGTSSLGCHLQPSCFCLIYAENLTPYFSSILGIYQSPGCFYRRQPRHVYVMLEKLRRDRHGTAGQGRLPLD